jgi:apolipoprotein N-acyltransferase
VTTVIGAQKPLVLRLRLWASALTGWRRSAAPFAAGAISVLAFAPFFCWPVLFLTLPLLVWVIDAAQSPRAAGVAGWWFGFGYFVFGLFWIGEAFLVEADKFAWLLPFAVTILPAGLALFWGLAAWASRHFWSTGFDRVIVLAIAIGCAEWLRGNVWTGLPWNILGYALTSPLALMQSAGLFGIYGLTLLAVPIFAGPVVLSADTGVALSVAALRLPVTVAAAPLLAMWAYGAWQLNQPQMFVDGVKIRIVQPSVPQNEKWLPQFQRRIFDDHLALSKTNTSGKLDNLEGITHVIWPEAAMPFLPLEHPEALSAIADVLPPHVTLMTGALRRVTTADTSNKSDARSVEAFNSILVFDDVGKLSATYDKIHLVPFGEYLPFERVLNAIGLGDLTFGRGAFTPGGEPRPLLSIAGLPVALGLICYEAIFPSEAAQSPAGVRAGLIVNVTNDGWFGNSTGPRQHFHQTRVRAVEQGLPILRAANNGISGVIDGRGRVVAYLGLDERGVVDGKLPVAGPRTLYAHYGDKIFLATILGFVALRYWVRRYTIAKSVT